MDQQDFLKQMNEYRKATHAARERLNDPGIGVAVKAGNARIERVTFNANGTSNCTPISDWMPIAEVTEALDAL